MPFLIPAADDLGSQRADLSLGLRAAARHYSDLVVPGIGGASRVRHLSWAVAGIRLREDSGYKGKAVAVAHGVEALACKLEWACTLAEARRDLAVPGKNAFRRNPDAWDFSDLSQRRFYVQVTQRQVTTRALPLDTGLGLCDGSTRYSGMVLTAGGAALSNAFLGQKGLGKGSPRLGSNLQGWIFGSFPAGSASGWERLRELLGPFSATAAERELVRGRLASHLSSSTDLGRMDPARRSRLMEFLDAHVVGEPAWADTDALLAWLAIHGGETHAADIRTALRFEELRAAGVNVVAEMVRVASQAGVNVGVAVCAKTADIRGAIERCREAAELYRLAAAAGGNGRTDALGFACEVDGKHADVVKALVLRDGRILTLAGETIWRGPAWRPEMQSEEYSENLEGLEGAPAAGRPGRLFQFVGLWRDCHGAA